MREEVAKCLDEIDACFDRMEKGKLTKELLRNLRGWVRKQKIQLKELGYTGKIRRQPKITAKKMVQDEVERDD
jgi:hypothetical protein